MLYYNTSCGDLIGCTNPQAFNYNPEALEDDGSCVTIPIGFYGVSNDCDPTYCPQIENLVGI